MGCDGIGCIDGNINAVDFWTDLIWECSAVLNYVCTVSILSSSASCFFPEIVPVYQKCDEFQPYEIFWVSGIPVFPFCIENANVQNNLLSSSINCELVKGLLM